MFALRHVALGAVLGMAAFLSPAQAKEECTTLFYSVNDYGKEGPTRDAEALLDKLIQQKMAEKGVKKYKTGKKAVDCELFLDFVLFDEHTCKATAQVCWPVSGKAARAPATTAAVPAKSAAAPAKTN